MAKQGGFGVVCKITISNTLTAIANVEDVDFPEFEKFLAEVTNHGSTGGYAEHIATGVRAVNEFSMTLTWDTSDSTHAAIVTAFDSDEPVNMSIEDPAGVEVIAFAAHVRKLGRISKQRERYGCVVTIQPTGQPSIT